VQIKPIQAAYRLAFVSSISYAVSNCVGFLANSLAFYYGSQLFLNGELDVQDLFTVVMATVFGSMASGRASAFAQDISKGLQAAENVFSILDRIPRISRNALIGKQIKNLQGHIEFKDITFAYPTRADVRVLQNFNLNIQPGETVAVVGPSGSGKSTLIALLERFYDPNHGDVLVDGVPLRALDLELWRSQIGYVGQEPVLFDLSIEDNITYGCGKNNPKPDAATINKILEDANVKEFVDKLPEGLSTVVGERASQLSGG
jgi:ABC-type multidrug transport system fused ATPase/permease subunit